MSIVVSTDVFCDKCGVWEHGATGSTPQASLARRIVRDQGWVRTKVDGKLVDLCPRCSEAISPGDRVWVKLRASSGRYTQFYGTVRALGPRGVYIDLDQPAPTLSCYATYGETVLA